MSSKKTIDEALGVAGYTDRGKLELLYNLCRETGQIEGDVLEIGSAYGRSTIVLASSGRKIWSIDPHTGEDYGDRKIGGDSYVGFVGNLRKHGISDRVVALRATTESAAALIPSEIVFSLVYIDGLHTAEAVKIDLDFSFKRTRQNGIIVLDDYFEQSVPDYRKEIDGFIKAENVNLIKDCMVWFRKS